MDKKTQLETLKSKMVSDNQLPLRQQATQLVFGEGNPDSKVYFLGEAPGFWEDKKGRPFVGQAGQLLDKLLESIGLKRTDVYISNIVRFRPPQNRDPLPEEIAAFAPYIDQEISIIEPKIIITLGRFSMNKFLPEATISQIHGQVINMSWQNREYLVIPMYHPAAALRSSEVLRKIEQDFQIIPEALRKISPTLPE